MLRYGQPYRVLAKRELPDYEVDESKMKTVAQAGDIVYAAKGWDYGLARDDTFETGVEHVSVTKNADGEPPSFTIPVMHLRLIDDMEPVKFGNQSEDGY